jgi:myo-inositol-1(or 4)-monophosphatase
VTAFPGAPDPAALARLAATVARAAGDLIRSGPAAAEVTGTKSSPSDVVTAMDAAAEALLRRRLRAARPGDAILGEEAGLERSDDGPDDAGAEAVTWVLDPIDGTVNYLYGIPAYAVSVAAVLGDPSVAGAWSPLAGCVHNPVTGETWTAALGRGATYEAPGAGPVRLAMSPPPPLAQALVGTGFGYRAERRRAQARVASALLPAIRDIRRIGAASLDLCALASGRLDAFYERGLNVWDMAAGVVIVTEAGGTVSGLDGVPAGSELLVAAAPPLHGTLQGELAALNAASDD